MKKLTLFTLLVSVLVAFGAPAAFAGAAKVTVCHIPPGNPDNFHSITISENAYAAHLAHGDLAGPCDAACATLCDDGNACTIDDTGDCEQLGCPVAHQAIDCDDSNECTTDSCDTVTGCVNTAATGQLCDDGLTCTGVDICDDQGVCSGPAIDNCCLGDADCSQNPCDQASCDLVTNRCSNAPVICNPSDLCHVNICDPSSGDCSETPVACNEGETCNPATGQCEQSLVCPCWTQEWMDSYTTGSCYSDVNQEYINNSTLGFSGVLHIGDRMHCELSGPTAPYLLINISDPQITQVCTDQILAACSRIP